jgi:hypothetical protein
MIVVRPAILIDAVQEAFAQRLQFRIAPPHDLVPRVRIFGPANVAAESGYETDGITEPSGLGDSFFFA